MAEYTPTFVVFTLPFPVAEYDDAVRVTSRYLYGEVLSCAIVADAEDTVTVKAVVALQVRGSADMENRVKAQIDRFASGGYYGVKALTYRPERLYHDGRSDPVDSNGKVY